MQNIAGATIGIQPGRVKDRRISHKPMEETSAIQLRFRSIAFWLVWRPTAILEILITAQKKRARFRLEIET
jgi:hypothetical protein